MPLIPINPSRTFEIWAIDFVGPFSIPGRRTRAHYIIIAVEFMTKWAKVEAVDTCSSEVATKFIYENIIVRFGCPLTLLSDQGTHFINKTIAALTKEFKIAHLKTSSYHPQANGAVESFNKTLVKGLTKICNRDKNDWDDKIPAILWAYRTTYKRATNKTPFRLVYGQEAVVPLHFQRQEPLISHVLHLDATAALDQRLFDLNKLEEDRTIAIYHQVVQKQQQKAWHDRHLKKKDISMGDTVLLYDNEIKGKPKKLHMAWLGPYLVTEIHTNGSVRLTTLQGRPFKKVVNGARLKRYYT